MKKILSFVFILIFSFSLSVYASNEEPYVVEQPSLGLVSSQENLITDPIMISRLNAGLDPITGYPFNLARSTSVVEMSNGKFSSSVNSFPSYSPVFVPEKGRNIWLKIGKSATTNITFYWKIAGIDEDYWYTQDVVTTLLGKTHLIWGKGTSDTGWSTFYMKWNSSTVSSFDYEVYH